ncbi:MAG: type II secretion system F family protein [Cryobacterium sp.]|nr:type II secretion system F family protein [Cryobacterium sp.]
MLKIEAADEMAGLVQRLAVLLLSGANPATVWTHAAESLEANPRDPAPSAPTSRKLDESIQIRKLALETATRSKDLTVTGALEAALNSVTEAGAAPGELLRVWRQLGTVWSVAEESGSPLGRTLLSFADSLQDVAETGREIETALAGPKATARVVLLLPLIGILFGLGLGFDLLGVLFGTDLGRLCLLCGGSLAATAVYWNKALIRRAGVSAEDPGLVFELYSIALAGGVSIDRAREVVAAGASRFGLEVDHSATLEILNLSARAGVPIASLLKAEATLSRRRLRARSARAAGALGVKLLLPLGVCILPSFLLLGVVPLMLSIVPAALGGL